MSITMCREIRSKGRVSVSRLCARGEQHCGGKVVGLDGVLHHVSRSRRSHPRRTQPTDLRADGPLALRGDSVMCTLWTPRGGAISSRSSTVERGSRVFAASQRVSSVRDLVVGVTCSRTSLFVVGNCLRRYRAPPIISVGNCHVEGRKSV